MLENTRHIYLAGPMAGLPDHNFPLFNRVARRLRDDGYEVFNPAENDDGGVRRARAFYMRLDIPALMRSDAVALLPGWEQSRGASLEVWLAIDLGLPLYRIAMADEEILLERAADLDLLRLPFLAEELQQERQNARDSLNR